jgi:hypothetical protein
VTLLNIKGKLITKNVSRYRIDWDKKSRSIFQFKVKQFLKPYWFGHQCFEEFPVLGTLLKVDIVNMTLKVAIECDGHFHNEFSKHFHNNNPHNYLNQFKRDVKKEQWLEMNDFKIIHIEYGEENLLSPKFIKEKFNLDL